MKYGESVKKAYIKEALHELPSVNFREFRVPLYSSFAQYWPPPNNSKRYKLEFRAIIHTLKIEESHMKKSKFTEAQIVFAIKQSETGVKVD